VNCLKFEIYLKETNNAEKVMFKKGLTTFKENSLYSYKNYRRKKDSKTFPMQLKTASVSTSRIIVTVSKKSTNKH